MATVAERLAQAQATVEVLSGSKAPTVQIRAITLTPDGSGGYSANIEAAALNGSIEVDSGSAYIAVPPGMVATINTLFNAARAPWKTERGIP